MKVVLLGMGTPRCIDHVSYLPKIGVNSWCSHGHPFTCANGVKLDFT